MLQFSKSGLIKLLGVILSFGFSILVAKYSKLSDYGEYSYFVSTFELIAIISGLGLSKLFLQEKHQSYSNKKKVLKIDFQLLVVFSTIIIAIPLCLLLELDPRVSMCIILYSLYKLDIEDNRVEGDPIKLIFYQDLLQPLLKFLIFVGLLIFGNKIIASQNLIDIFILVIILSFVISRWDYRFNNNKIKGFASRIEKLNWGNALIILINILVLKVFGTNFPTIINFFTDELVVGQFAFSLRLGSLVLIPVFISGSIIPQLLRDPTKKEKIYSTFIINSVCTFVISFMLLTFGENVIQLFKIKSEYLNNSMLALICYGYFIQSSFGPIGIILNINGKNKYIFKSIIISLIFSLIFLIVKINNISGIDFATIFLINILCLNIIQAYKISNLIYAYKKVLILNTILLTSLILWNQFL